MISTVHKTVVSRLTLVVACAAAFGVSSGSAFAQEMPASDPNATEQVIVTPPQFNITRTPVPNAASHGFASAQATSISLPVSYSDLDLSTPAGMKELEKRLSVTATGICRELNRRFPSDLYWSVSQFPPGRRFDCVQNAVKDAMNQIQMNQRLTIASASR